MEISHEDRVSFERVRHSGLTNMYDVKYVSELSGLSKETILAIMDDYQEVDLGKEE